jgi:hypothetical protein
MKKRQTSKIYKKLVNASNQYEAFKIVEGLKPELAKELLICLIFNKKQIFE